MNKLNKRIGWIDQLRGLSIFLVVYGHNFPIFEKYIYTFHVPLFFIISGFFHPRTQDSNSLKKRFKNIIIPYFLWSLMLFLFWFFLGRFYGESTKYSLSVLKNFIGIFYAQGGREYMDWGIPMWFLPSVFLTFFIFYYTRKIKQIFLQILAISVLITIGFFLPFMFKTHFLWSFDVALAALVFYSFGFFFKSFFINLNKKHSLFLIIAFGVIHFTFFTLNSKVDMYRSIYGNELLFVINGISGSVFYLLFLKTFHQFKLFEFIGKSTIPILALHLRALTVIKFVLLFVFGFSVFHFSELEKFVISIFQILMVVPVIFLINKYIPILNGKIKTV